MKAPDETLRQCHHGHYVWQYDARVGWMRFECNHCIKEALDNLQRAGWYMLTWAGCKCDNHHCPGCDDSAEMRQCIDAARKALGKEPRYA